MNDLRLILLGIGLLIIAGIYFWGTFKQKNQDRSRLRKIISFKKDTFASDKITPAYEDQAYDDEVYDDDEVNPETLAELDAFLTNPKSPDIDTSNFSLRAKAEDPRDKNNNEPDFDDTGSSKSPALTNAIPTSGASIEDESVSEQSDAKNTENDNQDDVQSQPAAETQIITFLIKASPGKAFTGLKLLEATKTTGFKFGDMDIFHHHGTENLTSEQAIFSLVSMYEPGNFNLEKMESYQTMGLALFMQLPAPVENMAAFNLMQETAMKLADMLDGEIWSSKHKPIDEKALMAMRDMVTRSS